MTYNSYSPYCAPRTCSGRTSCKDAKEVCYTGPLLPCTGIISNDRLDTILGKIDYKLCNLDIPDPIPGGNLTVLPTIEALEAYTGESNIIFVTETDRGGIFNLLDVTPSMPVNTGTVFSSSLENKIWVRDTTASESVNVRWFGAKGDGVTDDTFAIQTAVDFCSSQGSGTVFFPRCPIGQYYRIATRVYWRSFVNILGEGQQSLIYNDTPASAYSGNGAVYPPIYFGNYSPFSYNDTETKHYLIDNSYDSRVTLENPADISNFQIGQIVIVRSIAHFLNENGSQKPFVIRINRVRALDIPNNQIILEDPVDVSFAPGEGEIAVTGVFLPGAPHANDDRGVRGYYISDINVQNVAFKSNGQWLLRYSAYKANWRNIWTYGAEGTSGNGMAYNRWENIRCTCWKQASESAIACHNTVIQNVIYTQIENDFLIGDDQVQPIIRFGENVHKVELRNIHIDGGASTLKGIRANGCTDCIIDNLTMVAPHLQFYGMVFETIIPEAVVKNITLKNSKFYLGSTDRYIDIDKEEFEDSMLEGITVENCEFYGAVTTDAIRVDARKVHIKGNYFENGELKKHPVSYIEDIVVEDNFLADPSPESQFIGYDITFRNNRNTTSFPPYLSTGVSNTGVGIGSLASLSGGNDNTAVGVDSLASLVNNSANTAIGWEAMQLAVGAGAVVAVGTEAGKVNAGTFNVFVGQQAGLASTTGGGNVFVGRQAGVLNTTGFQNIFIGRSAGGNCTTGSVNLVIGTSVDLKTPTTVNHMNLGNCLFVDNFNNTTGTNVGAGRLGVNVNTPLAFLHVKAASINYPSVILAGDSGDPTSPPDGSLWYKSVTDSLNFRHNGVTTNLATMVDYPSTDYSTQAASIVFDGTPPSNLAGASYRATKIGTMVTLRINVKYTTAGTTNTTATLPFPTGLPNPESINGFTAASNILVNGTGGLASGVGGTIANTSKVSISLNSGLTGWQINITGASISAQVIRVTITYWTA